MAVKKRKCKECRAEFTPYSSLITWCSPNCGYMVSQKALKRTEAKKEKSERALHREKKKAVKRRSEWLADLQIEVNKYVRLRDKDEPCCTCGTTNNIKYDAGHYRSVGACPDLRFELTNIHKQCSVKCNQYGSGMRLEYRQFIINKYGNEHLDWLDGYHPSLKETLPHWQDIEAEIKRYRKLIRDFKA